MKERGEKRERSRLRTRGERVIAVTFFFDHDSNIFVRELRCCSRTRRCPLWLSVCREEAVDGKKREKERKEEQESSEETPTGQPTRSKGRDTLGSRVRTHPRMHLFLRIRHAAWIAHAMRNGIGENFISSLNDRSLYRILYKRERFLFERSSPSIDLSLIR